MSHHDLCSTPTTRPLDNCIQRWNHATKEQENILNDLVTRNLELEARNAELEKQIKKLEWRLRSDQAAADAKEKVLIGEIDFLRSEQESFKATCLLDGDGCIFSEQYLCQGYEGGIQAAQALSEGLTRYLRTSKQRMPTGCRILTMLFLSKSGMEAVLCRNHICTLEQFRAFMTGFGTAHPLFSVVDVGMGKEAADFKMRDYLKVFVRLPQTFRVFFGGGHDNGYGPCLTELKTEGLQEKIVVLQSYTQLAREIALLKLPDLMIPDLFMPEKLERRPAFAHMHANTDPTPTSDTLYAGSFKSQKKKRGKKRNVLSISSIDEIIISSPATGASSISQTDESETRLPCLAHHYSPRGCLNFVTCRYDHSDELDATQEEQMKDLARCTPCEYVNEGRECPSAVCHYGHKCPRGSRCQDYLIGVCKFVGLMMHQDEEIIDMI
ncbi:SubName: Full=Uncharacterized protein {ECO:0000313/EMBL:CCA68125.1} [Serendipita indica DSM 11827]|nr:SubName: Full=Uncharacterized protein {ECO:0000313/EMBL:CCA68125.1} [Serendipita indica DSM 11827]